MHYVSQNARFSRCSSYRYSLEREWNEGSGRVLFIGLNPSTADHKTDDPTTRRCAGFARDWSYAAMEIVNLFDFRATLPKDLKMAADPVGKCNDKWIRAAYEKADLAIACWGNDGQFKGRDKQVLKYLQCLPKLHCIHCIAMTQSTRPAHPLYLRATLQPKPVTDFPSAV